MAQLVYAVLIDAALWAINDHNHPQWPKLSVKPKEPLPLFNPASADAPLPVYYGYVPLVDPIIVYREARALGPKFLVVPSVTPVPIPLPGTPWTFIVAVIGEGEIESVDAVYLDGLLTTDPQLAGNVVYEWFPGTDTQNPSTILLFDLFTADLNKPSPFSITDRGKGVAYVVLMLKVNTLAFPGREPRIQFAIRGKKTKDTRDGVTRFSPNSALAIRDYWTNTRYGRKVAEAKIDDAKINAEANYFDERLSVPAVAAPASSVYMAGGGITGNLITFAKDVPFDNGDGVRVSTTGVLPQGLAAGTTYYWMRGFQRPVAAHSRNPPSSTPAGVMTSRAGRLASSYANALAGIAIATGPAGNTGTLTVTHFDQPRYSCNGRLDPYANPLDSLAALRSSCRSWFFESGGKYHLVADKVTAPSFDLSVDNIVGQWTIGLGDPATHFNRVEAHFKSVLLDEDDLALADSVTERTADGGRLMAGSLQLDFTTNWYQAERLAQMERRASRVGMTIALTTHIQGYEAFCGQVVRLTHPDPGFNNKLFRIARIDLPNDQEYPMELREYADSVFTMDAQGALVMPERTNLTGLLNQLAAVPPTVSGLEVFNQGKPA